ncbi:ATP-dependent helicase [Lysinibacillus boronitolerans]|uniref:DNA 3'-5' helicase n=1 Tax=Lysinibacillus boronitolerans JCM 21713 = 10a = NBRC 103108 TaxID=1294264 RepID=A0ABR4XWI1_9BACI|nr:ATP-dependent helicase [Lysinibacillus boronitolerans]KGR83105.1 helicase UvrD [Lysinibacillus boronitolerans JCM 21713 = 10a = NBRC 103108]
MNAAQKAFFEEKERSLGVYLNDVQKQAVLQTNGPLLLLASPGSGKTTTIIMRIGYMIEALGVKPARIKAVTFSKASANDMKARFAKFFPHLPPVDFSTIHSLAFQVVRETLERQGISYGIMEEADQPGVMSKKRVLREIFEQLNGSKITEDQLDELLTYITFIKNKMLPEQEWAIAEVKVPKKVEILHRYEEYKRTASDRLLIDFDDMLLMANDIFTKNREVLAQYQRRYDFYLTDESQDTSPVQHAIIEKLVAVHQNLCVVADEDQAIYSWRGAEPDYLLNFQKIYPEAHVLLMTQNYRSSASIVEPANLFIQRNKKRYNKQMFTENPAAEPISFKILENYSLQAKYVVNQLKSLSKPGSTAVLYRNNTSAIPLMDALDRAGLPFYMKDSTIRFFTHWVVEDIMNFMRLAYNTKNISIFEKVYRKMNAYLTPTQLKALQKVQEDGCVFTRLLEHVELKEYQPEYIKRIRKTYDSIQFDQTTPTAMLEHIRYDFGYERALKKMSEDLGFNYENLLDIVDVLGLIARHTSTMTEFAGRLKYLENLARTSHLKNEKNAITLTTLHSSKGLEFDRVYLIDLIDGILPSETEEAIEEETRLFYVGITRAIRHLELISYNKRFKASEVPSMFMNALKQIVSPQDLPKKASKSPWKAPKQYRNDRTITKESALIVGSKVKHVMFGEGEILAITSSTIKLSFEAGIKQFMTDTCLQQGYLEAVED